MTSNYPWNGPWKRDPTELPSWASDEPQFPRTATPPLSFTRIRAKSILGPRQAPGTARLSWPLDGIVPECAAPSLRREGPCGRVGVLALSLASAAPQEASAAETLRQVTQPLWFNCPAENQAEKHSEHLLSVWMDPSFLQ